MQLVVQMQLLVREDRALRPAAVCAGTQTPPRDLREPAPRKIELVPARTMCAIHGGLEAIAVGFGKRHKGYVS